MKKIYLIFLLILFTFIVSSQNLDHLMTRKYISCQDVEYNCSYLIPNFYKNNKIDSVFYSLKYWEKRCGKKEIIFQSNVLLGINQNNFDNNLINSEMIKYLIGYRRHSTINAFNYIYRWGYYNQDYTNGMYNDFLDSIANENASQNHNDINQEYLSKFYTKELSLNDLEKEKYCSSIIGETYSNYIDSIMRLPEFTYSIYSGIYYPMNSLGLLGYHGIIGLGFGGIFYNNSFDLMMDFKFGPSKTEYTVMYQDSLTETNKYTGMYVGLEYSRTLLRQKKSEYLFTLGLGFERITAIPYDAENEIDALFLYSPNYSAGLGYRYRYNYQNSLFFQLRYQYLDFDNPRGTKLLGNSVNFRLIWVISNNYKRKYIDRL